MLMLCCYVNERQPRRTSRPSLGSLQAANESAVIGGSHLNGYFFGIFRDKASNII